MTSPQAALIACRFLGDTALMLLWGSCAYLAWCVPEPLSGSLAMQLRTAALAATAVAILAVAASLPVQTALIGNGWPDALDGSVVWSVLALTGTGRQWFVEAGGGCALLAGLMFPLLRKPAVLAVLSALMLAGLALNGHAATQAGPVGLFHRLNDALHVLAGGAWLGALVPFVLVMGRCETAHRPQAVLALRRFSRIGHVAVALVLASGIVNVAFVLGKLPLDWHSPYQAKLMLKIAAVATMTLLAIVNRYVLLPRLSVHKVSATRALKFSALAEFGLGLASIALVAGFGTEDPV